MDNLIFTQKVTASLLESLSVIHVGRIGDADGLFTP